MTILCIDGYNFLHRARSGFKLGEHPVCFNFFRNLRSLVEQFKPNRVYFVTEGKPVRRLHKFPEYKANRRVPTDDPKRVDEYAAFLRQKDQIIDLLSRCFPVSVMRHPEHEGDDVIYNLVKRSSTAVPWVVVSNDSDFTQLLNEFQHVQVYNPMEKSFVEKPEYDYVDWKSFRGDGSDNIPGIPGVGDKNATKLVLDPDLRKEFFAKNPTAEDMWAHNYDLIKLFDFDDHTLEQVTCSTPQRDWNVLKQAFEDMKFQSLLKDKAWTKYLETFDPLWGT